LKRDNIKGQVLFIGPFYYNMWYLSRELRKINWHAITLNIDPTPHNQMYYHGEDYKFNYNGFLDLIRQLLFYIKSIFKYDIFHFGNAHNLCFGNYIEKFFNFFFPKHFSVRLLKKLGKKIVYSNNGCLDGVSQTSFRSWGPEPVCDICIWRDHPEVCSDERNLAWGKLRNELTDFQITIGGNRKDYNDDDKVREVPEFYCLDENIWHPDILVPTNYKLPFGNDIIKIYHSVGNYDLRSSARDSKNIKCTHIYMKLIDQLKSEGMNIELIFFKDVPNVKLRYYQVQSDIVVDMLTFGFFGANAREAMMLGKPVICFLRPEWLESMRREIPQYVDELPIVSATPDTIYSTLKDLIGNRAKREQIGRKSREFAVKWHSSRAGAKRFDQIYTELLQQK